MSMAPAAGIRARYAAHATSIAEPTKNAHMPPVQLAQNQHL